MPLIRLFASGDFDAVYAFASAASEGLTNLPKDRDLLQESIEQQVFFVLEDEGEVIGCSAIRAEANHDAYRLDSGALEHIGNGFTELTSLFLLRHERGSGLGRLLSLSRFLYIGAFSGRFGPQVIASLRGTNGKVHPNTKPAEEMLTAEGMRFCGLVDTTDGGPFLSAPMSEIRTIRERRQVQVEIGEGGDELLLSNDQLDFRATLAQGRIEKNRVWISENTLQLDQCTAVRSHP